MWRRHGNRFDRASAAVASLELPEAVFKTCPWQPRSLVETGLRQWLRCCAPAVRDRQVIGMPSRAVDEAWHGLILCTARYSAFCQSAYGTFLHHHPEGGVPDGVFASIDGANEQLRRTVIAWTVVADPGEQCVLWNLDSSVGVDHPWGVDLERVAMIQASIAKLAAGERNRTIRWPRVSACRCVARASRARPSPAGSRAASRSRPSREVRATSTHRARPRAATWCPPDRPPDHPGTTTYRSGRTETYRRMASSYPTSGRVRPCHRVTWIRPSSTSCVTSQTFCAVSTPPPRLRSGETTVRWRMSSPTRGRS